MTDPAAAAAPDIQRLMSELEFLSELARVMASNTELQPILDWIVIKTSNMLSAEEGSIRITVDPTQMTTRTIIARSADRKDMISGSWPKLVSLSVMGFLSQGRPLATPDLHDDERFQGLRGEPTKVRAVLAVPLVVDNRVTGMLAVTESRPGRQWSGNDIQLLSIVASHSAGAIEQARLREAQIISKALEERNRRLEEELVRARETQMTLVPARPMRVGAWEAAGRIVPARAVGGDAFDYFPISESRFGLAIADVSGKGIPAALLMSNVVASLRAFCNGRTSIPDAIRRVNQSFTRTIATGKFITLFYCEVDISTGMLQFVNAGHNPPLLRRENGDIEKLTEGGVPIGIFEDWEYVQGEVRFHAGDALMLYSDGISEAFDPFGTEYGEDRLEALWREQGSRPPIEVIEHTLSDVAGFRASAEQSDDMTLVVLGARGAD